MKAPLMVALGAALLTLPVGKALADNSATWPFDLQTHGEDIQWLTPTPVDNTGDYYVFSYHLSNLIVTVRYLIFDFDVDVTDQIPPEFLDGSEPLKGPPPFVGADEDVAFPPPPDPPSVAAHIAMGLKAGGYGYVEVTNVYLGEADIDLGPPWGVVHVTIKAVRVVGTVTATAYKYKVGDLNCDDAVDAGDIDPFFLGLADPLTYAGVLPQCDLVKTGDINGDGAMDAGDIDAFFTLLGGG